MREEDGFMSSTLTREKKNGSFRMILNLKQLNKYTEYELFKMGFLQSVLNIIKLNCWMASVDLKDVFYTVSIHSHHQKFLRFKWQKYCYAFSGMLNGYSEAIRIFTKPLKLRFSIFRSHGYLSLVFVDDSYLQGHTFSTCEDNVNATVDLLQSLGFTVHLKKSFLAPTQEPEFLGFVFNSVEIKIKLTDFKSGRIIFKIKRLLYEEKQTIRNLAFVIGSLVVTFPVLPCGKFHYRELERYKIVSLKLQKGKYNAPFTPLSTSAIAKLHWWLKHLTNANKLRKIDYLTMQSRQILVNRDGVLYMGCRWSSLERNHTNIRELRSILLNLKSNFWDNCTVKHVHILTDNSTALAYISNNGGMHSVLCNNIAKRTEQRFLDFFKPYSWCREQNG